MRYLCVVLCVIFPLLNAQGCRDTVNFCHQIVNNKKCDMYESKVNCRKSCNLCNEPVPQPPPSDPACTDSYDGCQQIFYVCGAYPDWEQQCRKTCEVCKPKTKPEISQPEKPKPPKEEEKPKPPKEEEKPSKPPKKEEKPSKPPTDSENTLNCPNVHSPVFNSATRNLALKLHNDLRSELADGTVKYARGKYLGAGKNIYQFSWDCELEKTAQPWANRCQFGHSTEEYRNHAGESIYYKSKSDRYESAEWHIKRSITEWWEEVEKYDASYNPQNIMDDYALNIAGHWTQQAWGKTTKLGCGIFNCTESDGWFATHVVCHYRVAANKNGEQIFEPGNGCSRDEDCTTYKGSKCNTSNKLCIAPDQ